jgi:phospholipase C
MLGFSGITGADASTGDPTSVTGLAGTESNIFAGQDYPVLRGADFRMPVDPGHEFPDVVHQLCGPAAEYPKSGPYPAIDKSGFVASYAATGGSAAPGEVMKCYTADQLPVLNALAREFVICDNWHSPLPGPTWPNRMFVHAASSGGLDHSPGTAEILAWEMLSGIQFPNGTIFDRLKSAGIQRCLYGGDDFPIVAALKGINPGDIRHYSLFAGDLAQANHPYQYVFIEPNYDVLHDYRGGTSQHPLGDVTAGELLIKETYEAIRNSSVWASSVLIVTWDEHGGFFDHVTPPPATAPGDTQPGTGHNQYGFTFQQYGVRVPSVVISPLIPKNLVDHRRYDHSCIPKFLETLFGLEPMTARDRNASGLDALITLATPRGDAPVALPAPAVSSIPLPTLSARSAAIDVDSTVRPGDPASQGNLPVVIHSAMRHDLATSPASEHDAIVRRVSSISTRADAARYLADVQKKTRPRSAAAGG